MSTPPAPASPAGASVVPGAVTLADITAALTARYPEHRNERVDIAALRVYFDLEVNGPVTALDRMFYRGATDADILIERTLAAIHARNKQRGMTPEAPTT
jgi:hypothetical protein